MTDFGWRLLDRALRLCGLAVTHFALVRELDTASYGTLATLLAGLAIVGPIAKLGAGGIVTNKLLLSPNSFEATLRGGMAWRLLGGAASIFAAILALPWLPNDIRAWHIMLLVGVNAAAVSSVLQFHFDAMLASSRILPLQAAFFVAATALKLAISLRLLTINGVDVISLLVLAFAVELLGEALILSFAHWRFTGRVVSPRFDRSNLRWFAERCPWIVLSGIADVLNQKIDVMMLSSMVGVFETGIYAAAAKVSELTYVIPTLLMVSFFPLIWRRADQKFKTRRRLTRVIELFALLGLLLAGIIALLVAPFFTLIFGPEYERSGIVLVAHVFAAPFVFMRVVFSRWLIAEDLLKYSFYTSVIGMSLNVLLNFILIPVYGALGAAIATLLSYFMSSCGSLFFFTSTRPFGRLMLTGICRASNFRRHRWFWRWFFARSGYSTIKRDKKHAAD
jgi:O-antigen/teichoic acid export membrane protein